MNKKYDLIEKYLMNEMSAWEQASFEKLLKKDSELRKEYLFRKGVNEAIIEDDVIKLRNSLTDIMNEEQEKPVISRKLYIYSSIAAAVILFLVVINIYLFPAF